MTRKWWVFVLRGVALRTLPTNQEIMRLKNFDETISIPEKKYLFFEILNVTSICCWSSSHQKKIPLIGSKILPRFEGRNSLHLKHYLGLINPGGREIFFLTLWLLNQIGLPTLRVFSFSKHGMHFRSLKLWEFHWYNSHWRLFSRNLEKVQFKTQENNRQQHQIPKHHIWYFRNSY